VAHTADNIIIAWTWVKRGIRAAWSDEEMACINMVHIDLTLPPRLKIKLIKDMIELWEAWAKLANIPIISSTTMRDSQTAYLKLHAQAGYTIRGSNAYKRLST
jgi:hypothetical protein